MNFYFHVHVIRTCADKTSNNIIVNGLDIVSYKSVCSKSTKTKLLTGKNFFLNPR